ncbi:MAG: cytochrome b/b6 domain-containing protein [Proteobacteria bacterium]|nr:cytochrome b/b6 domain-containing protein [Pseudomonadota bacterium]
MTQTSRYTAVAITLHWIIAILMIFMLFPGEDLIKVREGASLAGTGPSAHASIGLLILLLSAVRLAWRIANPPPPLPPMPAWQRIASRALHDLFYVLMIAIPVTGWFALVPYGAERLDANMVTFFKLFPMAILPNIGEWTKDAHELLGTLAKLLLFLHVAAALKHQFWDRDGTLTRMWYGRKA